MSYYGMNPRCTCGRCRVAGLMGPAVLITLGILFLLQQTNWAWSWGFHRTWPVLLIVIGIVKVLQYTAPTEGHIPRGYVMQAPPIVTPPPVPPAGSYTDNDPNANRESGHV
jgi:hypothetical protein